MAKEKKPSCFVATVPEDKVEELKEGLLGQGFKLEKPAYTLYQGKKTGLSVTVYESGKLVVQGKNMDEFITFYLEPEILHTLTYSNPTIDIPTYPRIGIDEAGKGDYFGPLCIGGVYSSGEEDIQKLIKIGVKDSKTISDKKILTMSQQIRKELAHSVIRIFPKKYNELYATFKNLNSLLAWGHVSAIENLHNESQCKDVIIDQFANESVVEKAMAKKNLSLNLVQRTKGENDIVVAAASILSRASFVEGLEILSEEHKMELPKGASAKVIESGKEFVFKSGFENLFHVAKLHFSTTEKLKTD